MHGPRETDPIKSIALITSLAVSAVNFRGTLIQNLVGRGIRVYVFAPDYDDMKRSAVSALGAEPIDFSLDRAGMRPVRDCIDLLRLTWLLRRIRPDAVLANFVKPAIYGTMAAFAAGVRHRFVLISGLGFAFTAERGTGQSSRKGLLGLVSVLFRLALSRAHRVVFQNPDDLEYFIDHGLVSREKVRYVRGSGIDLGTYAPAPAVHNPPTFLIVARLLRDKGIYEFVEAAKKIATSCLEARFLLVGDVDSNPSAIDRSEVVDWVLDGLLEWPGHVEDVRPWIAQASVFVLPSYREGLPRSTQEAMAMARPIITTDTAGCRETVEDGINGFLVPVGDAPALANAMQRFIECPDLITSMGRESRRLAEERFDVREINAQMLEAMGIA